MKLENIFGHLYTIFSPKLKKGKINNTCIIVKPLKIENAHAISIEKKVYIGKLSWLMGGSEKKVITLKIDEGTQIGHFAHIIAMNNVHIKKHVLIADKVFISDCTHNYDDVGLPILSQGTKVLSEVTIGEDSWIGENVCICGASIGKHCVIGANSVVTKDIPDYCVAAGIPAKVIKKYNFEKNSWERI